MLICFIHLALSLTGQSYLLTNVSTDNTVIRDWQRSHAVTMDSTSWMLARAELINALHDAGYLLAEINKWQFRDKQLYIDIEPGPQIYWASIKFAALEFLPLKWVAELDLSGDLVNYDNWKSGINAVLEKAQNEGYLFADYRLEVEALKQDSLYATVFFNPGRQITLIQLKS